MRKDPPSELKAHMPFAAFRALSGIAIMHAIFYVEMARCTSRVLFWMLHPVHVLFSALFMAAMYRFNSRAERSRTIPAGHQRSIGIATRSDSTTPYSGEFLPARPSKGIRSGLSEGYWLVNPLVLAKAAVRCFQPRTRFAQTGYVLLSTWAALFYLAMAPRQGVHALTIGLITGSLLFVVWGTCCMTDILSPFFFARRSGNLAHGNGDRNLLDVYIRGGI